MLNPWCPRPVAHSSLHHCDLFTLGLNATGVKRICKEEIDVLCLLPLNCQSLLFYFEWSLDISRDDCAFFNLLLVLGLGKW